MGGRAIRDLLTKSSKQSQPHCFISDVLFVGTYPRGLEVCKRDPRCFKFEFMEVFRTIGGGAGKRYPLEDVVAAVKESIAVARGGKVLLEG